MFQSVVYNTFLVICVFKLVVSEDCQRDEVKQGCIVEHGHAQCESWDLAAAVHGLPACIRKITFSLTPNPGDESPYITYMQLSYINFNHLANLTELSVIANWSSYGHFRLVVNGSYALYSLQNLHILRLKVMQDEIHELSETDINMYSNLKQLEVLDLTRAKRIGLSNAKRLIGHKSAIKTLVLKHIQDIRRPRIYSPTLDIAHFICGTAVRILDLSYNDITYVNISSKKCDSELRHLNFDHNIIASFNHDGSIAMSLLAMGASIKTVSMSLTSQRATYDEKLWTDENYSIIDIQDLPEDDEGKLPLAMLLQQSPLASLSAYTFWFQDIITHCGKMNYINIVQCFRQDHQDLCDIFLCLSPALDIEACPKDKIIDKLEYFSQRLCNYESCMYNIPLPFPPKLKTFIMNNTGVTLKLVESYDFSHAHNLTTLCIHPHNSLEYLDLSFIDLSTFKAISGSFSVSGLDKLKYVNIQGCQLAFTSVKALSPSMTSLRELHIGGNIIASNSKLPGYLLQTYTMLTLLNLSNANLLGIEPDAFRNHQNLTVLDLSYNHLTMASILSIDLSKTRLRSLNVSYNRLTAIPGSLRGQLEKMEGLDLYLSGNTFTCNCGNLDFLEWVQSTSSITFHYAGDHVCTDSPGNTIHNIEVDSLHCNWYWMQPLIVVVTSLALTLLGIALFVAYRKRWFISNLMFRLRERFFPASDEQTNIFYKYDAFVSYSSADGDRQWVHLQLVKELEEKYGFRLCVHQRDFRAGPPIVDNITKAIQSSRKVLVVMSNSFLKSDWCIEEVHMTGSVDINKFIVIMYKDVSFSNVPIPPVVQRLLESRTNIEWNETPEEAQSLFWKKLRKALHYKHNKHKVSTDVSAPEIWDISQSLL